MFELPLIRVSIAAFLAVFPVVFWGYIFYKKQPEVRKDIVRLFIAGCASVAPLLLYKYLWQYFPWINAFMYTNSFNDDMIGFANITIIPIQVIMTFMIVGIIEEVAKYIAVSQVHHKRMCSITDCMEFFIIVALGFSFIENIIYFNNIMSVRGVENVMLPFIFRSLFSTFAHIMFSGILGYYYGMAMFAKPLFKEDWNKNRWTLLRSVSKAIGYKKEIFFHHEMIITGLVVAISLHAVFNIMLEMNWTFLIIPFLTFGFITLSYLFDNKHIDKSYCEVDN